MIELELYGYSIRLWIARVTILYDSMAIIVKACESL